MVACFRECRWITALGGIIGVFIAFFLYPSWQTSYVFAKTMYAAICIFIGIVIFRIVAMLWAKEKNKRFCDILYKKLEAKIFIEKYLSVVQLCKEHSIEKVTTTHTLAYGYEAIGEYSKAQKLLKELHLDKIKMHRLSATVLVHNALCRLALLKEDVLEAQEEINELFNLVEVTKLRQPAVSKYIKYNLEFYNNHLAFLKGEEVDLDYMKEELSLSRNLIYEAQISFLLGRIYVEKDICIAKEFLRRAAVYKDKLKVGEQAFVLLKTL